MRNGADRGGEREPSNRALLRRERDESLRKYPSVYHAAVKSLARAFRKRYEV